MLKHKSKSWKMNRCISKTLINQYKNFVNSKTRFYVNSNLGGGNDIFVTREKFSGLAFSPVSQSGQEKIYFAIKTLSYWDTVEKNKKKGSDLTRKTRALKKYMKQI